MVVVKYDDVDEEILVFLLDFAFFNNPLMILYSHEGIISWGGGGWSEAEGQRGEKDGTLTRKATAFASHFRSYPLVIQHVWKPWHTYRWFTQPNWWFSIAMLHNKRVLSRVLVLKPDTTFSNPSPNIFMGPQTWANPLWNRVWFETGI